VATDPIASDAIIQDPFEQNAGNEVVIGNNGPSENDEIIQLPCSSSQNNDNNAIIKKLLNTIGCKNGKQYAVF
jgi:hypothetical protein